MLAGAVADARNFHRLQWVRGSQGSFPFLSSLFEPPPSGAAGRIKEKKQRMGHGKRENRSSSDTKEETLGHRCLWKAEATYRGCVYSYFLPLQLNFDVFNGRLDRTWASA